MNYEEQEECFKGIRAGMIEEQQLSLEDKIARSKATIAMTVLKMGLDYSKSSAFYYKALILSEQSYLKKLEIRYDEEIRKKRKIKLLKYLEE